MTKNVQRLIETYEVGDVIWTARGEGGRSIDEQEEPEDRQPEEEPIRSTEERFSVEKSKDWGRRYEGLDVEKERS